MEYTAPHRRRSIANTTTCAITVFCLGMLRTLWAAPGSTTSDSFEGVIIRRITVSGNQATRAYIIEREIESQVGQPFQNARVQDDIGRLQDLSLFSAVVVNTVAESEGVALEFQLREMPRLYPYPAFKYTEENGLSAGIGLALSNMQGRSIRLGGNWVTGGSDRFVVGGSYPWITGNHVSAFGRFSNEERENKVEGFTESTRDFMIGGSTHLGRNGRAGITATHLRLQSDEPDVTLDPDNEDNLHQLGLKLGLDTRDSLREPRKGWFNEIEMVRTGGPLGGNGDSTAWTIDLRRFHPTVHRQQLVIGTLLQMQTGTLGNELPTYLRYKLGGANSIRGYDAIALGQELNGRNQFLGTFEYSFTLFPVQEVKIFKWNLAMGVAVAAFMDSGIAWSDSAEFTSSRWRTGWGIGLRLLLPVLEYLRLDLGVGDGGDVQFHLAMGTKFGNQRKRVH